jgi:hypothetical protein
MDKKNFATPKTTGSQPGLIEEGDCGHTVSVTTKGKKEKKR